MKDYPSWRYHPELAPRLVSSEQEDAELVGWFDSPGEAGFETDPGAKPDPVLAARREKLLASKSKPAPKAKGSKA